MNATLTLNSALADLSVLDLCTPATIASEVFNFITLTQVATMLPGKLMLPARDASPPLVN